MPVFQVVARQEFAFEVYEMFIVHPMSVRILIENLLVLIHNRIKRVAVLLPGLHVHPWALDSFPYC